MNNDDGLCSRIQRDTMTDFDEIRNHMDLLSDEELLAIVREHDGERWRPEVFDIVRAILSERGRSVEEDPGEELEEPPGLDLAIVASYANDFDAEADRLALETKGIDAWVVRPGPSTDSHSEIVLKVRQADWRAALELLDPEVLHQPVLSSDLPEEIAEPPCPRCGSRNVREEPEIMEHPVSHQEWVYRCSDCNHQWPS